MSLNEFWRTSLKTTKCDGSFPHKVRGDSAKDEEQFTCLKQDTNFHHVDKPYRTWCFDQLSVIFVIRYARFLLCLTIRAQIDMLKMHGKTISCLLFWL